MAEYRSKSYSYSNENNMQIEPYYGPPPSSTKPNNDFRSYSVSYVGSSSSSYNDIMPQPTNLKKVKSTNSWGLSDPEFQRKKRVASYKVYSVEGKVKGSFRKSVRWLKDRYSQVVYGWW